MHDAEIAADDGSIDQSAVTPLAVDPLADLLFNMVAIIVIAVIVILPTAVMMPPSHRIASTEFTIDGRKAQPLVATADGIRFGASPADIVSIARILDDESLAARLDGIRERGDPLLLLIAPDGMEAAFLIETVASRHGPAQLYQVRLDGGCAYAKSALGSEICPERSAGGGNPAP